LYCNTPTTDNAVQNLYLKAYSNAISDIQSEPVIRGVNVIAGDTQEVLQFLIDHGPVIMHGQMGQIDFSGIQIEAKLDGAFYRLMNIGHPRPAPKSGIQNEHLNFMKKTGRLPGQGSCIWEVGYSSSGPCFNQQTIGSRGVLHVKRREGQPVYIDLVSTGKWLNFYAIHHIAESRLHLFLRLQCHVDRENRLTYEAHIKLEFAQAPEVIIMPVGEEKVLNVFDLLANELGSQIGRRIDEDVRLTLNDNAAARPLKARLCLSLPTRSARAIEDRNTATCSGSQTDDLIAHHLLPAGQTLTTGSYSSSRFFSGCASGLEGTFGRGTLGGAGGLAGLSCGRAASGGKRDPPHLIHPAPLIIRASVLIVPHFGHPFFFIAKIFFFNSGCRKHIRFFLRSKPE
jgi:hypothetical protein